MWLCRPARPGWARPSLLASQGRARPGQADVCTVFVGLIARSDVGRAWQKPEEAGVIALLVLLYLTSLLASYRQSLSLSLSVVLWHPHYDESSETIFLVY